MLDSLDHRLLAALQADGQATAQELAERLPLSASQIGRRRQRLEAEGYVTGYRATLSPERLGLAVEAFIQVAMAAHTAENARDFRALTRRTPEVTGAWTLTGEADYLLRVHCRDLAGAEPAGAGGAAAASGGGAGAQPDRDGPHQARRAAADPGRRLMARALWIDRGRAWRSCARRRWRRAPGDVVVETRFSGISRGTEALVCRGGVPRAERDAHALRRCRRASFPFPVKYGYAAVGRVAEGPAASARAATSSCCIRTRTDSPAPAEMAVPLPPGCRRRRAVLAANMETALNVVWDAGAAPGDRIAVVGAGAVGALAGWLCARLPGSRGDAGRHQPRRAPRWRPRSAAASPRPTRRPDACDLVIHASATGEGLATALAAGGAARPRWSRRAGTATGPPTVGLGGAFHSRRLRLVSSQVGAGADRAPGALERPCGGSRWRCGCSPTRRSTR